MSDLPASDLPTADALRQIFLDLTSDEFRGQTRVVAPPALLHGVLETLKERFGFDLLVDLARVVMIIGQCGMHFRQREICVLPRNLLG